MKNNLENAFKDKLSEFEAPYDPQAWEAVKGRLDAKATGESSSAWKWIAATAVVAAIAVTSIVILDPNETTTADVDNSTEVETPNNIDNSTVKSEDENISVNHANNGSDINPVRESDENLVEETNLEVDVNNEVNPERNVSPENNDVVTYISDENGTVVNNNVQETATPNKFKYITGNVTTTEICYGEQVAITNNGAKNEIVRFEINGKTKELKKATTVIIKPEVSTVINFKDKDNNIIDSKFIKVNELPTPDFRVEANIFEKGLPVTICEAYGDYQNITWDFEGETEKEGGKVKHHFFEKGDFTIILKVSDFNGCENTKEKEVRIENQYNLLAVGAFKPNDSDPKNKTFMPFSLTQRDVNFTLTIIDPRDNGIVFTSKDASNPWTGIDERTGKMTDSETVFIWRVQIENSLPNERPVYAGSIVHN